MKLRSEKMEMIQQLINIDDEKILEQVKNILKKAADNSIHPMSLEEFYEQIEKSENDFKNGNFFTTEQLKNEISTWKKK